MVEAVADLCTWLRTNAPKTHILLTSRSATRAPAERIYLLRQLQCASGGSAMVNAALELFMAAAQAVGYCSEITDEVRSTVPRFVEGWVKIR